MKDCLKKRGLDVRQARRMVQGKIGLNGGGLGGECMGRRSGDEPFTLMRLHSYIKPLKGGSPSVAKSAI